MIHDVLASLPEKDRRLLMYAHEHVLSQFVIIGDKFIGVNVQHMKSLNHEESIGAWSCGTVKGAKE